MLEVGEESAGGLKEGTGLKGPSKEAGLTGRSGIGGEFIKDESARNNGGGFKAKVGERLSATIGSFTLDLSLSLVGTFS